jgi:hypothetical protein
MKYQKLIDTYLVKPDGSWLIFGITVYEFKNYIIYLATQTGTSRVIVNYYNIYGEIFATENLNVGPGGEIPGITIYPPVGTSAIEILHDKDNVPNFVPIKVHVEAE